jgi:hypothetical protein
MNTPLQLAAFTLADFLSGDPGAPPYRAVAFVLGTRGHRNAGLDPRTAARMHARSLRWAKRTNEQLRAKRKLDYDPLEVVEINSFDELIAKRPRSGTWQSIFLVTHARNDRTQIEPGSIFFGDRELIITGSGINELRDEINRKKARVDEFRRGFDRSSPLLMFACGVGTTGPEIASETRELFGVEGAAHFPRVNRVDLLKNGTLVTPDEEDSTKLRELAPADMSTIPPKEEALPRDAEVRPP